MNVIKDKILPPLGIFLISRIGLFLTVTAGLFFLPINSLPDRWQIFPNNPWLDGWLRFDTGWYVSIAQQGYHLHMNTLDQSNTAFFPLYPLLIRLVMYVVHNPFTAAILVSNLAALIGAIFFYNLVEKRFSSKTATLSLILLLVWPFSFYFSSGYVEALLFCLSVAAFYFGEQKQWFWAAVCIALASATKSTGILLIPVLALLYLEQCKFQIKKIRFDILWLVGGVAGLLGYMRFLQIKFNDPLLFIKSQYANGWAGSWGWNDVITVLHQATYNYLGLSGDRVADIIHLSIIPIIAIVFALGIRKVPLSYWLWSMAVFATGIIAWRSFGRILLSAFPVYIMIALLIEKRPMLKMGYIYLSILFLTLFAIVFSHWYWVAG